MKNYVKTIVVLVIAAIGTPAASEGYEEWLPGKGGQQEVTRRYLERCPKAQNESGEHWKERCVPEEALYALYVPRVVDAAILDLAGEIVILANVEAPTYRAPTCAAEIKWAASGMHLLRGVAIGLEIKRLDRDAKGRISALLRTRAGKDLGEMLIEAGFAVPTGHARPDYWCRNLAE